MRRLLLTLVLVPLAAVSLRQPSTPGTPPQPPPGFETSDAPIAADDRHPSVLVLPLDTESDALSLTTPADGVAFDVHGTGHREQVSWTRQGQNVAFLAVDLNGNGRIDSGREIFGSGMRPDAKNGVAALLSAMKDSGAPLSGSVHQGHPLYDRLLLWIDRNHNGVSEPNELRPAKEPFTAIGLGYTAARWRDRLGNGIRYVGWMQLRTGGSDQLEASTPQEDRLRDRRLFDVVLQLGQ